MKEMIGFLVFVWFLLCGFCVGRFVVEKNSLKVTSPNSLKNVYECAIGDFGVPQYGGTLVGTVFYPKANRKACRSFGDFGISFKSMPGELPTVILADRGDCYFKLKAWNAQSGGAAAILVADDRFEPLITMDTPEDLPDYLQNITIPSALISKSLGDSIKKALSDGEIVSINLDWREALPHPDERVEFEFWTNSNDECGPNCDNQIDFVKNFKGAAQVLERKGYTQFTPHYITWYCPEAFVLSKQCRAECINHGRYCAPDPEQDFSKGYDGRDVVVQNLRQACFYKVANESGRPWLWWDYVTDFAIRCPMKEKKYNAECANQVIESLGVDLKKIEKCIGDPTADEENAVLKAEQDLQIGKGTRGDVTILPTLIINNRQYRGKLAKGAVLKAICAGFQGTTKPAVCLTEGEEGEHRTDFVPEEFAVKNDDIKVDKESIDMLSALVMSEIPRVSEVEPQVVVPSQGYGRGPQGIRRFGINTPSSYLFMENIFGDGGLWKEFKLGLSFSSGDSKQGSRNQ